VSRPNAGTRTTSDDGVVRVLVTGSRYWTNVPSITGVLESLADEFPDATLMHGDCRGADRIAAFVWASLGLPVEAYPVDWSAPCGPKCPVWHVRRREEGRDYCPEAGPMRNRQMINRGPVVCVAFPRERPGQRGSGTSSCIRDARLASVPVRIYSWRSLVEGVEESCSGTLPLALHPSAESA
jgi:hypothetical protein